MKKSEFFEKMIAKCQANEADINEQLAEISEDWNLGRLYKAYHYACRCDSPYVSFNDHFWDKDIDPMCNFLDMAGITEIAFTFTSTGLMDNCNEFQKRGWMVTRLEELPVAHKKWTSKGVSEWETKAALILIKTENY